MAGFSRSSPDATTDRRCEDDAGLFAKAGSVASATNHASGELRHPAWGHTFAIDADRLLPALYLTIASGVVLMTMEIPTIGLQWLFMGKGATVLLKPSGSYCPDRGGSERDLVERERRTHNLTILSRIMEGSQS